MPRDPGPSRSTVGAELRNPALAHCPSAYHCEWLNTTPDPALGSRIQTMNNHQVICVGHGLGLNMVCVPHDVLKLILIVKY